MILGILFLLGAAVLVFMAWRALRHASGGDWVRAEGTRIVVEVPPGREAPRLRLESAGTVMVAATAVEWAPRPAVSQALGNPDAVPGRIGGAATTGRWRVAALLDLSAPDTFGTGDAALDRRLAESLGGSAMLLHGVGSQADGSIGGLSLPQARYDDLAARLGDPKGLALDVMRRRIQRAGWGGERAQRRRPG